MIFQIARHRSLGVMRAIPDIVDHRALRCKLGAHPVMQRDEIVLGKETARDAGLIGEDEHEISCGVQPVDRPGGIRHPAYPLTRAHIAVVVIDDAVAIEKGRGLSGDRGAHLAAASLRMRRAMSVTSEAAMSRMQRWSFMVQTVRWQGWQDSCVLVSTVAARPLSGAQR